MATLEKIRSRSGLLIASIAIALLCFVVGDALNNSSTLFNNSRNSVGEVNGKSMTTGEFQKQVSVMSNVFKMAGQSVDDGNVRDAVWNTYIQSVVLGEEAEEIGMSVTAAELKDATLGEHVHPMLRQISLFTNENGQFDKSRLVQVLSQMDQEGNEELKDYWMFWEKRISETILSEKFTRFVEKAMTAPKAEVDFLSKVYSTEKKVAYAAKPYSELADSLFTPSAEALKAKYAEKKESYKTDGYRVVKCVVFDVRASQEDYNQTSEKVKAAEQYLKNISDEELPYYVAQESDAEFPFNPFYRTENDIDMSFRTFAFTAAKDSVAQTIFDGNIFKTAKVLSSVVSRPDSVDVSVILIGGTSVDAAAKTADSLLAALKSGSDFKEVAAKHSADPNGRQNGGEWGWLREGLSGSASFDSIVFNAKVGDVVKVQNEQAIFLVKINAATAPVKKVRLAEIANQVLPSGDTYRSVFEKANSFIAKNNTAAKFDTAAAAEGLLVRELGPFTENQSNLYVIENGRPIVKWAYEANLGDVCTKPFDSKDKYLVAYVSEIVEKGYVPENNKRVQDQLSVAVIKDMKAEKIKSDLSNVSDLASVGRVDTATVSLDLKGVSGIGPDASFIGNAVNAEVGKITVVKGDRSVFAIQVLESNESSLSAAKADRTKENVRQYVISNLVGSLMNDAEVEDTRSRFY